MENNTNISTARLILREYQEGDFTGVHAYASDPETVRFMTWGPNTPEDTSNFISMAISEQKVEPRINYYYVVTLGAPTGCTTGIIGEIIGGCGIHIQEAEKETALIGYAFNQSFWGKGFATEAVGALIGFGFDTLGLRRIKATCDTRNIGSRRVMEKNGMFREGQKIHPLRQKGEWRDSYLYAILAEEWQGSDSRFQTINPVF